MAQITKVTKKSLENLSLKRKKALLFVVLHHHILLRKALAIQMLMIIIMASSCRFRNVVLDSTLRGPLFVLELLNGNPSRMFSILRMTPDCFIKLSAFLSERTSLKDTRITVEEKLAIFLYISANNSSNRCAQDQFQRGGGTISTIFRQVVKALLSIRNEVIEAPRHEEFDAVTESPMTYFRNCIGAIDGTHIPITMPKGQERYRCRKGFPSLNVMVVVDFNMKFRHGHSGWEGSAHDSRVLQHALNEKFFVIPDGTYYLADGGYGISSNILTPYRNVRYHLKEHGTNTPKTAEELFNLRHSSLRNHAERTIGKFKKRFRIMKEGSEYSPKLVAYLVKSLAVVHNFIQDYNTTLAANQILAEEQELGRDNVNFDNSNESPAYEFSEKLRALGRSKREAITREMWQDYKR